MPLATIVPTAAPTKNDFVSVAMLKHTFAEDPQRLTISTLCKLICACEHHVPWHWPQHSL